MSRPSTTTTRRPTRHLPLGLLALTLMAMTWALGVASSQAAARHVIQLEIGDDASFRRAVLDSSPVFALAPVSEAMDHWAALWAASSRLDDHSRSGRRSLLASTFETLLSRGDQADTLKAVAKIRDTIETDSAQTTGRLRSEDRCDWIVLNRLLGDNHRTVAWITARCDLSARPRLPRQVRSTADAELHGLIQWDETCDCPIEAS